MRSCLFGDSLVNPLGVSLSNRKWPIGQGWNPTTLLVLAGAVLLFAAYLLTFALTTDGDLNDNAWSATYNAIPAILLALLAHSLLVRFVWPRTVWIKLLAQVPAATLFALSWYLAILVMLGMRNGWLENGFTIRPFVPVAFVWQMFQGVTFYALVALASLSITLNRKLAEARAEPQATADPPSGSTIFIKNEKEHEAISFDEIICISGAGDYSEVILDTRRVLSTSSLAEFEGVLPDRLFLRIHRSHLVRLGAIQRSEPAGNGRTTVHLKNGETIIASRSGTRLLRSAAL